MPIVLHAPLRLCYSRRRYLAPHGHHAKQEAVFEKTDYRNNWGAADLEDGYYVYVLKGDGIKTIKETLAIKRTAN